MPKSSTALKASVTLKAATPVLPDMTERLKQLRHHQAAEALNAATPEPEPARDLEKSPRQDPHALQSAFLAANLNRSVTVFLMNGIKLIGRLRQYDPFTILLEGPDGVNSLTFKHTISILQPVNRT